MPYADARIINLARRENPDCENIYLDLTDERTLDRVAEVFMKEMAGFQGERALFIQNAALAGEMGFVGEVDPLMYRKDLFGIAIAPIILADAFIRAVLAAPRNFESGLVMMSSASARSPYEGQSAYCAGKAGIEHWVRVARRERKLRGAGPWIVAVRPGFVDTPMVREVAARSPKLFPAATAIAQALASGVGVLDIDTAAKHIWAALPPTADSSVLMFGTQVQAAH
jgi:NAD(P)-dependent dehydrogenase (short-subunit alcohol dehydrogenase family)